MAYPFKIGTHPLDGSSGYPAIKYGGASYSRQAVDSDSTGRNQKGTMIRDKIAEKDKWQLEFAPCTQTQLANLLVLLDSATFNFTYPDPTSTTGAYKTAKCYCGDRSAPILLLEPKSTVGRGVALWGNFKVNIIEC